MKMKTRKVKVPTSKKRPKRKTAVLYTRVASRKIAKPDQSLLAQEIKLREYCEKENIEVIKVYHDSGSGMDFKRPEFRKFLKELKAGTLNADYFLFTSIDRFCRRLDGIYKMHHELKGLGITPKAIEDVRVVYFAALEVKPKK